MGEYVAGRTGPLVRRVAECSKGVRPGRAPDKGSRKVRVRVRSLAPTGVPGPDDAVEEENCAA